jgi:hypothetical protein
LQRPEWEIDCLVFFRVKPGEMLPDNLIGRITLEPLRAYVPTVD